MSYVNVIIVRDDCVYFAGMHYRSVKSALETGVEGILPLLNSRFLDAGYVVLDLNRRVVINGQSAFSISSKDLLVIQA